MKRNFISVGLVTLAVLTSQCSSPTAKSPSAKSPKSEDSPNVAAAITVTKPSVAPELLLKSRLVSLLMQGKYEELNSWLESYQKAYENDFHHEDRLVEAFDAFSAYDPGLESHLDEWVRLYPKSYSAFLARAHYFNSRGWSSRGFKRASETSDTEFAHMEANFQKAADDVEEAFKLRSNLLFGFLLLLDMDTAAPKSEAVPPALGRALSACPASFQIRNLYIQRLAPRWVGSYDEMRQFADEAQQYAGLNPKLRVLMGFADWDQGCMQEIEKHTAEAVESYTRALSYGDHWLFYNDRAGAYYRMDRYEEALSDVNQAIKLRPQMEECYILRSRILFFMEKPLDALRDFQAALQIWPYSTKIPAWGRNAAEHLVYGGHSLYQQNKYAEAIQKYNLAVEFDPQHAEAYYWRGTLYMRQGRLGEAQQDLEKSVQLNPRHFESYRSLDWVLAKQGKWDSILEHWNSFLALEPKHATAYLERGGTFYQKGDLKSALQDAQKACELGEAKGCAQSKALMQKTGLP